MAWTVYIPKNAKGKDKKFLICPHCEAVVNCYRNNTDENKLLHCPVCGKRVIEEEE